MCAGCKQPLSGRLTLTMTTENSNETAKKTCPINDILENLRAQLHAENQLPAKIRPAVARVARLVTEVTLGRGNITAAFCALSGRLSRTYRHPQHDGTRRSWRLFPVP